MRHVRLVGPAFLILVLGLFLTGALQPPTFDGLPSTPAATLLLLPVVRMIAFISGAVATGGLLIGGVLGSDPRLLRVTFISTLIYAAASATELVFTLADLLATNPWPGGGIGATELRSFVTQIDDGRYLLLRVLLGLVVAFIVRTQSEPLSRVFALLTMVVAVSLPAFSGHSAAAISHWAASTTMVFHLAAMNIWVGGVIALFIGRAAVPVVARFSPIASASYAVLILGGLANLLVRTQDWEALFASQYGALLGLKTLLALGLGAVGAQQKVRAAEALRSGSESGYRTMLAVEVSLMLTAMAFALVLARIASP